MNEVQMNGFHGARTVDVETTGETATMFDGAVRIAQLTDESSRALDDALNSYCFGGDCECGGPNFTAHLHDDLWWSEC